MNICLLLQKFTVIIKKPSRNPVASKLARKEIVFMEKHTYET